MQRGARTAQFAAMAATALAAGAAHCCAVVPRSCARHRRRAMGLAASGGGSCACCARNRGWKPRGAAPLGVLVAWLGASCGSCPADRALSSARSTARRAARTGAAWRSVAATHAWCRLPSLPGWLLPLCAASRSASQVAGAETRRSAGGGVRPSRPLSGPSGPHAQPPALRDTGRPRRRRRRRSGREGARWQGPRRASPGRRKVQPGRTGSVPVAA